MFERKWQIVYKEKNSNTDIKSNLSKTVRIISERNLKQRPEVAGFYFFLSYRQNIKTQEMAFFAMPEFLPSKEWVQNFYQMWKSNEKKAPTFPRAWRLFFPLLVHHHVFYLLNSISVKAEKTVIKQQIELLLLAFNRKLDTTWRLGSLFQARNDGKNETDK